MPNQPQVVKFGVFEVDLQAGEVRKAGMRQKLTGQPFQVLQALLERPQEIVTREELRERLWPGNTFVDYELGLKKAVNRVREVLGDSAESPHFIETIPKRGYRFLGTLEAAEQTAAALATTHLPTKMKIPRALTVGLALALIAALLIGLNVDKLRTRIFAKSRSLEIRSIAVLPLQNLSNDPDQDYFSDGITDALTTDLAQIGSLRVISRTSAVHFKAAKETLPEIGRDLNVDAIVEGTVTRSENHVRITAQLIDAQTDRHLWAKSYERELKEVLALQDEVARDIAGEIRVKLTPEERTRLTDARSVNPEAHEAYLRGRFLWNQRTEAQLHKAKEYFEQAIAKDPGYAAAYSGLADTYFYLSYGWGHIPPKEGMPLARAAALKSIELNESAAEGHASLGAVKFLFDWDWRDAEQELRRAIALNPNYEMGHHAYSVLLGAEHRYEESVSEARKAVEVDPLSVPANNILSSMLAAANRWDEAFAQDEKALELDPNPTHLIMFRNRIADYYRFKGMTKEAIEEDLKARAARGASPQELEEIKTIYDRSGRKGVLQREVNQALKRWEKDHWHNEAYSIASLYAELGDMDSSFKWIDKCIELRSTVLIWIYVGDNAWRKDARFAEVQRKMGVHY
jgi:TolB-like protein/DNA-binding winged helix-turn-helix (wHTH) protein/Tfp pilus assembly protein PilF